MPEVNLFDIFTTPLTKAQLTYCITGSVAAMLYGEPRLTHDVDLVIELSRTKDIISLEQIFPQEQFYVPPQEVIRIEAARERRGHINLIHMESGYKADLYLAGDDPFHHWALENLRLIDVADKALPIAPPEYVIVRKLQYFKEGGSQKHLRDIQAILRTSSAELNQVEISRWVQLIGVEKEWALVK